VAGATSTTTPGSCITPILTARNCTTWLLEHPGKLGELVNLWFAEAGNNAAFPLDDRSAVEIITTPRPQLATPSDRDSGEPVTDDYPGDHPHAFTGGTIKRVVVDVSGDPYLNLEREAQAMLARE
jgi:hypothetical protein